MQETQVWALGREDPLELEMATHSNILAWKISWTQDPGGLQFMGSQRVRHYWAHTEIKSDVLGFLFVSLFFRYFNCNKPALSCLWAFAYAFPLTWSKVPFSSDSLFLGFLSRHCFLKKAFLDTPSFPKPQVCIDRPSYGFPENLVFPISIEPLPHPPFFKLLVILSFLSYFLWGQAYVHLVPNFPSRALAGTSSWHKKFIQ